MPHRSLEAKDPTDVGWTQVRMRSSEDVTATRPEELVDLAQVNREIVGMQVLYELTAEYNVEGT